MKHLRHTLGLLLTLALFGVLGLAFAQTLTPAGTVIQNTATATYRDADDNPGSATSNTVTTTVQEVFGVTVEPSSNTPSTTNNVASEATDPTEINFGTATPAYESTANAGSNVEFLYTVTNNSNANSDISLDVVQDGGDAFDFDNVQVFLADEFGVISGGALDLTQPIPFTPGQEQFFVVRAAVPNGQATGDTANLDLVAVNDTAVAEGQEGPNVSFDNNNIARVTVTDGELGLAKDVEAVVAPILATGTNIGDPVEDYRVTFDFYLENTGTTEITGLSLIDDLTIAFDDANNFDIVSGPSLVSSAGGAVIAFNTTAYDGATTTEMLDTAGSSLPVGATARIRIIVRVDGPFDTQNQAVISGTDGGGATVTNQSTDGVNPNPNTSVPTPVLLESPVIAVSKTASYDDQAGAPFDVQFSIFVENQGDVQIQNLSVVDDLDNTFGAGNYSLNSAPTLQSPVAGVQINPGYTGSDATTSDSIELIDAGSTLNVDGEFVIVLDVRVLTAGDYFNTATASGTGPGGTPTTNDSNNSTTPSADPNDDEPTPVSVNELNLEKSVQTIRGGTVVDSGTDTTAQPGDTLRYTIRVENTSSGPLTNIIVTDTIPVPTVFDTFGAAPTTSDGGTAITVTQSTQPSGSTGANVSSVRFTIDSLPGNDDFVNLTFDVTIP
ncbi:MAG: hypothetical protein U5L04_04535 [Trueperaceae bacterium]|nr:hypothetical protein [Trueperaceae bacterium]